MLTIKPSSSPLKYNKIWRSLFTHNKKILPFLDRPSKYEGKAINFYAYDNKTLVGGILCQINYNWLYIDILHVDERMRGQNIGTQLIQTAENYAKQQNLTGLYVHTFGFQAQPFYEKCGFKTVGCLENLPPSSKTWILQKELK